jgi:tetratricopeptide (TPR) repeat protein
MAKRTNKRKGIRRNAAPVADRPDRAFPKPILKTLATTMWIPVGLAALAFLVYSPSLKSDLVYDSPIEIVTEGFISSISNLPQVLSLKVLGMKLMLGSRPGDLLYLMLIAAVCGKEPFGYHLCSNLLHAANVGLLFILLLRLARAEFRDPSEKEARRIRIVVAAAALIFALHPLNAETVANVSFSSDLLVTFFTLLTLVAATAFRPENFRRTLIAGGIGALCAGAAVTCKESGVAADGLLVVYWYLFRRREKKEPWLWFLGSATVLTSAFLVARFALAPAEPFTGYLGGSFSHVFLLQPRLWVFMMGKVVWPDSLSADYTMENLGGLSASFAFAILLIVLVLQAWLARKSRLGALGVAVYWLGLATVSNFVPLYRMLGDRFYYLPLTGVALQWVALLLLALELRDEYWMATVLPFILALVPLSLATSDRQKVFASDFALWSATIAVSPFSSTAHTGLGYALLQREQVNEAIGEYRSALKISPSSVTAHYDLGDAFLQKGDEDRAIAEFQAALKIDPACVEAHYNLGTVLLKEGRVDEAIDQIERALQTNPNSPIAHYNLGNALLQKGRVDEAIAHFERAVAIDPGYALAHNNLGSALFHQGQVDEAIAHFQKAVKADPSIAESHYNLGNALFEQGLADEALAQFRAAVEDNPLYAKAYNNIGNILFQKGQVDAAIPSFQKAIAIDPHYADALANLGAAFGQQGRNDEAIVQLQKALAVNPRLTIAHIDLGNAFAQKKEWNQAIAQFREVLRLNPHDSDAQDNLAQALALAHQAGDSK